MIERSRDESETKVSRCLDYIRRHVTARTDELEHALGIKNPAALLASHVLRGELVTCKVTRPGLRDVNEYRIGAGMPHAPFRPLEARAADPARHAVDSPHEEVAERPIAGRRFIGPIEHSIPLPASRRGTGELRERMQAIKPGGSFETEYSSTACYDMARKVGIKVTYRPTGEKRIRVWRIA